MRLSVNMLVQIAAIVLQFCNLALDIVPDKYKIYILLVIALAQAVTGVLAHYNNPDGTSIKTAYVPPSSKLSIGGMGILAVLITLGLALPSSSYAQDMAGKVAAFGPYYSADIPGSVGGFAVMAVPVGDEGNLKSFSGFKIFAADAEDPGNLILAGRRLRYNIFTGFSYKLLSLGKLSIHSLGTGGFETNGEVNSGTANLGGFAHYQITPKIGFMAIGAAEYSGIEGAWVINPAGGLTFHF